MSSISNALCKLLARQDVLDFKIADIIKCEKIAHLFSVQKPLIKGIPLLSSLIGCLAAVAKKMIGSFIQEEANKMTKGIDQEKICFFSYKNF